MKICQVYEKQCLDLNGQETIIINIILTKSLSLVIHVVLGIIIIIIIII